jgi:hypothetical protein
MQRLHARLGWAVAAALAVGLLGALAGIVRGGTLDPPGPPSSTMKSLDDIPGSWDRKLSATGGCASQRFACVLDGTAVLDRETGLVWERQVSAQQPEMLWADAALDCAAHDTGGRLGWRLPTGSELLSLVDGDGPLSLPAGHPFVLGFDGPFWSSTTDPTNAGQALTVRFSVGETPEPKMTPAQQICVRSGEGSAAS